MARGFGFRAALAVGALMCSSILTGGRGAKHCATGSCVAAGRVAEAEGVQGAEHCSAGSRAAAGLVADEVAPDRDGMHLLQTMAFGKKPFLERAFSPDFHCWDQGFMGQPGTQLYLFHIPKTAACSLIGDVLVPTVGREKVYSDEKTYSFRAEHKFAGVMTTLRNPRSHVLSQYFECATSDDWVAAFMSDASVPARFEDYVHSWAQWQELGNISGSWDYAEDPCACYRPVNLQAQRYTSSAYNVYPAYINLTDAVNNMMSTEYVGIVEAYQETVCLFHAKLTGLLPSYCDCSDAAAWDSFKETKETHGEQPHSLQDYDEVVLAGIDSITAVDRELYRIAVDRFQKDILELESKFGTKIMCRDLTKDPALQYVFAPRAA